MRSIRTRFAIHLHSSTEELYNTNVVMWVRILLKIQLLKVRLSAGQHTVNMPWVSSILTPSAKSRLINWLEFLQQVYLYLTIKPR